MVRDLSRLIGVNSCCPLIKDASAVLLTFLGPFFKSSSCRRSERFAHLTDLLLRWKFAENFTLALHPYQAERNVMKLRAVLDSICHLICRHHSGWSHLQAGSDHCQTLRHVTSQPPMTTRQYCSCWQVRRCTSVEDSRVDLFGRQRWSGE